MIEYNHSSDLLHDIEARLTFLSYAALAFSVAEEPMLPNSKAWLGLYYFTEDLLDMTARANIIHPLA